MAERERSHTRPLGGVFVAHSQVLTAADVQRALTRMAHEVVERNGGLDDVVLVGLQTGGVPLAGRMAEMLGQIEGTASSRSGTPRRGVLPRRHRPAPGPPRGGHRHPAST